MTSKQALNRFNSFRKKAIFLFGAYNKPEIRKSMVFETILLNRPYHFFAFFLQKNVFFLQKSVFLQKMLSQNAKNLWKNIRFQIQKDLGRWYCDFGSQRFSLSSYCRRPCRRRCS